MVDGVTRGSASRSVASDGDNRAVGFIRCFRNWSNRLYTTSGRARAVLQPPTCTLVDCKRRFLYWFVRAAVPVLFGPWPGSTNGCEILALSATSRTLREPTMQSMPGHRTCSASADRQISHQG